MGSKGRVCTIGARASIDVGFDFCRFSVVLETGRASFRTCISCSVLLCFSLSQSRGESCRLKKILVGWLDFVNLLFDTMVYKDVLFVQDHLEVLHLYFIVNWACGRWVFQRRRTFMRFQG